MKSVARVAVLVALGGGMAAAAGSDARAQRARAVTPRQALTLAAAFKDLPLEAAAFASRAPGGQSLRLTIVAEHPSGVTLAAAAAAVFSGNRVIGQWSATARDVAGPVLIADVPVAAGAYRVRVAAQDTSGHLGTVDIQANAALTPAASGLSTSAMLVGVNDGGFSPRLHFANEPEAAAYFELYGGRANLPVVVICELAPTKTGAAIATLQPRIEATVEPDKFLVTAPIGIAALPPGDYIVRATVGLDGQPPTVIYSTLRKTR